MLNDRVGRLAAWLLAHNLVTGDRVASWLAKTEIACLMPLAAARAGLVHVPINPQLKAAQASHILRDSGAALLIANHARLTSLPDAASMVARHEDQAVLTALDVMTPIAMDGSDTPVEALCAILYTSGSTGQPKGVMLSHANLSLGAIAVKEYLQLQSDDRTLCLLPLSFDYGQNQLLSTWAAGGCAVPLDYLLPRDVVKVCAREAITTLAAVPPLWVQLTELDWDEAASAPMRRLTNSGGALTTPLVRRLRHIFGTMTDIVAMYGLTEAFRSTYLDPALIDAHPTSMGRAIPFAEIMVVDAQGSECGAGEHGELVHAGPLVAQGYWQDAERTARRFRPAPPHSRYGGMAVWSGDTVYRGDNDLLYFVGRDDAMIKSLGNRISPTEIEAAAVATGLVAEAVAIGVSDERLGQAIRLFVRWTQPIVADGPAADDPAATLLVQLRKDLPNFMVPHAIIALSEMPRNPNGKLDRTALTNWTGEGSS
jgi:acyl-CoA ligase (AMP-forming) (exosortase A-associated)